MPLKLLQKTAEATDDLSGKIIANKSRKKSKQNISETVESETEIPRCIFLEDWLKVIDELRSI